MHRYLSSNTKVILRLKCISIVNSHWFYQSLMTYMLNKMLNLKKKGKNTNFHPTCTQYYELKETTD